MGRLSSFIAIAVVVSSLGACTSSGGSSAWVGGKDIPVGKLGGTCQTLDLDTANWVVGATKPGIGPISAKSAVVYWNPANGGGYYMAANMNVPEGGTKKGVWISDVQTIKGGNLLNSVEDNAGYYTSWPLTDPPGMGSLSVMGAMECDYNAENAK